MEMQTFLMLLVTPVPFMQVPVKMSAMKRDFRPVKPLMFSLLISSDVVNVTLAAFFQKGVWRSLQ